ACVIPLPAQPHGCPWIARRPAVKAHATGAYQLKCRAPPTIAQLRKSTGEPDFPAIAWSSFCGFFAHNTDGLPLALKYMFLPAHLLVNPPVQKNYEDFR